MFKEVESQAFMVRMRVAFHENDGNHENDRNDEDDSDSYKLGDECWNSGRNHGNYGNDEKHGNPGCKPRVQKYLPEIKGPAYELLPLGRLSAHCFGCLPRKTTLWAFLVGNEEDSWTTEKASLTHFWVQNVECHFCYNIGEIGNRAIFYKNLGTRPV